MISLEVRTMKKSKKMTKSEAIFMLIAGLIMGTVFTFGMKYWNAPITQNETQQVIATFSSAKETMRRGQIQEIIVRFDDHEQLYIDGVCIDNELCDSVSEIIPGTVIEMIVHPDSNIILEMEAGTTRLLEFHDSVQKLTSEASGFMYLGIFCYIMALIGAGYFILPKRR